MKEREKKENIEQRRVLICNAKLVWNPGRFPDEDYILVTDTGANGSHLTNLESVSFEELARDLPNLGPDVEMIYKPEVEVEMVWVDGYFGRPPVPAEVFQLSELNQEQIKELEAHFGA